ncbi:MULTISPECIES: nuclear transport factor 2 family protein [unclassified Halomonas]|uniref:nuclear transport factor 2 family protein n=1 Tax=unclassified Halomonas TaxID=2609666 RepID=UPI0006DB1C4A|nr:MULTISPECIES: nuclear transport factor 2 family protein [unclassified Halomonas]KPQ30921.1 MAG: lumazine-binding protein [Halomonas sp. HL-93]SBR52856.1 Putative lumazine-binding [Halomonas sp. HL-93]SNY97793.1 Putative lumazine-binding [Halomonas sp. hl-4]
MTNITVVGDAPEIDEIKRVVQLYVDGFQGGMEKLQEAFHKEAWIFALDAEGALATDLISDRFERWANSQRAVKSRFIAITQAGEVASVLLGFDNSENLEDSWVDVIALLKVQGTWRITNKTAAHSSRAAWARPNA